MLVAALLAQVVLFGGLVLLIVPGARHALSGTNSHARGTPVRVFKPTPVATTTGVPTTAPQHFDAHRAMTLMRLQVSYGQRPAGSPQLRRLAQKELLPRLPDASFENLPDHPGLRNIVGIVPGSLPAIVIGAHYDSEEHPKGFVGANDSAAGTGALLELARDMAASPRPAGARELQFVLFDGEEEPKASDNSDFYRYALRGSKDFAAEHGSQVRAMILLDYIANKGLQLPREATSDVDLWNRMRAAATTAGHAVTFPDQVQGGVFDDHTPFLRAGIPAIDLIDFSYKYADGLQDTPDKLSQNAMAATGESVLELLRELDAQGY